MLRASQSGVITSLHLEPGQYVAAGEEVATLADTEALEVEAAIPESVIAGLSLGDKVTITFWSLPSVTAVGILQEIAPAADANTRTFRVRARVQNHPQGVRLGMSAAIGLGNVTHIGHIIPLSAVVNQTDDVKGVWLVHDGAVTFHQVTLGKLGNEEVEVLQGLSDGDEIVTAGVQRLHEGQKVIGADAQ